MPFLTGPNDVIDIEDLNDPSVGPSIQEQIRRDFLDAWNKGQVPNLNDDLELTDDHNRLVLYKILPSNDNLCFLFQCFTRFILSRPAPQVACMTRLCGVRFTSRNKIYLPCLTHMVDKPEFRRGECNVYSRMLSEDRRCTNMVIGYGNTLFCVQEENRGDVPLEQYFTFRVLYDRKNQIPVKYDENDEIFGMNLGTF